MIIAWNLGSIFCIFEMTETHIFSILQAQSGKASLEGFQKEGKSTFFFFGLLHSGRVNQSLFTLFILVIY